MAHTDVDVLWRKLGLLSLLGTLPLFLSGYLDSSASTMLLEQHLRAVETKLANSQGGEVKQKAEQEIDQLYQQLRREAQASVRSDRLQDKHTAAMVLGRLARAAYQAGLFDKAYVWYQDALALDQTALGGQHPIVANDLKNLAKTAMRLGRYEAAQSSYERAILIQENAFGGKDPQVLASLNELAMVFEKQRQLDQAEAAYRRALSIADIYHHQELQVLTLANLAGMLMDQGRAVEAEMLLQQSLRLIAEGPLPFDEKSGAGKKAGKAGKKSGVSSDKTHTKVAANANSQSNKPDDKPSVYPPPVIVRLKKDAKGTGVIATLNNLASLYQAKGNLPQAEALYSLALQVAGKELAAGNSPTLAVLNRNLALIYRKMDRIADAKVYEVRAMAIEENLNRQLGLIAESEEPHRS